jgi:hypothetical protein
MKSFAKNGLKGLLFVVILIGLMMAASFILVPRDNTKADWKHDAAANGILGEPKDSIDVLYLGDSEVHSSIVPLQIWDQYGYTGYCCSTNKQRLWYTLEFVLEAFKTQKPKIVVMETNNIMHYFSVEDAILHSAEIALPVLKYHDRWKNLDFSDIGKQPAYTYTDPDKGYYYSDLTDAATADKYMEKTDKEAHVPMLNKIYMKVIASICEKNGAKLVFLSTPSTKNWNTAKHNSMEKFAKSFGAEYVDLNLKADELQIDWDKDTRDKGDHMNYSGAVKVTNYIGKYLKETGILKSHKGDRAYESWNKAFRAFQEKVH